MIRISPALPLAIAAGIAFCIALRLTWGSVPGSPNHKFSFSYMGVSLLSASAAILLGTKLAPAELYGVAALIMAFAFVVTIGKAFHAAARRDLLLVLSSMTVDLLLLGGMFYLISAALPKERDRETARLFTETGTSFTWAAVVPGVIMLIVLATYGAREARRRRHNKSR